MCNVAAAARVGFTAGSRCMLFFISQITHNTSEIRNSLSEACLQLDLADDKTFISTAEKIFYGLFFHKKLEPTSLKPFLVSRLQLACQLSILNDLAYD